MPARNLSKAQARTARAALQEAIRVIGGPTKVGELFQPVISSQAVSQWDIAPPGRVRRIHEESDVPLERLAPDMYEPAPPPSSARAQLATT